MAEPEAEAPKPALSSRLKGRAPFIIAGAALALLVIAALWWRAAGRESTDDAQIDGHVSPVAAKVSGTVTAVFVNDNQVVGEGTVLVRIDPRDYETALSRARADLADAEAAARAARASVPMATTTAAAGVKEASGEVGTAEARVAAARAQVEEAKANEAKAANDLERIAVLLQKDEISRQEHDRVAAEATAARARREAAEAALREAGHGVSTAGASLQKAQTVPEQVRIATAQAEVADARVLRARAALEQALLNRQYTELKAPVAGIISKRSAEVGQVVQAGQALMAVVPLEDVWVTANFKETQLKKIRIGQPVTISVDAYGGRKYRGHVDSIAAATGARFSLLPPENATGNFVKVVQRVPVKIVIDKGQDGEHLLRPGLSVTPTVSVRGS
jgi:membrane fusion protein (multidrug efflux system)